MEKSQDNFQDASRAARSLKRRPKFGAITMFALACVAAAFVGLFIWIVVYGISAGGL
jgi:ferric-dicitrate binding protein FerR (iron transport regulator)